MKSKAESVIQKVCSVVIVLYIIVQYILLLVLKYCSHLHIQHHFLKLCFNTLDWKERKNIHSRFSHFSGKGYK